MQFIPKKKDIYISALRINLQMRILKYGANERRLLTLKKLNLYGLLCGNTQEDSVDIKFLAEQFSLALTARLIPTGHFLFFSIYGDSCVFLNRRVFEELLCELSVSLCSQKNFCRIDISLRNDCIEITADSECIGGYAKALIKILNASVIIIPSKNICGIKIPVTFCKEAPVSLQSAAEYISDPYSPVNLAYISIKTGSTDY